MQKSPEDKHLINHSLPKEVYVEVLPEFLKAGNYLVQSIEGQLKAGNQKEMTAAAHKLAGTAVSFGAQSIASLCRKIEHLADLNSLQNQLIIDELLDEWEDVLAYAKNHFGVHLK